MNSIQPQSGPHDCAGRLVSSIALVALLSVSMGCINSEPADMVLLGEGSIDAETTVDYGDGDTIDHRTAHGILALVNDHLTDVPFLVDDAFVARSAALRIVAHRRGPDGRDGTWDDDAFDRLLELDDVAYVGPYTLELLGEAAARLDLIPLVEVEGVPFTEQQVAMTLALVNYGSLTELDVDASLDARAAQALVHGRPFASLFAVGERPFVGPSALTALKFFAIHWTENNCED